MWENNERMYFMYISLFHMILLPLLFLWSAWNLSGRLEGWKRSLLFYFTFCWMYWSEKKKVFTYKWIKKIVLKWKKKVFTSELKKLFKNFKQFQNVLLLMPATQRWVFKWEAWTVACHAPLSMEFSRQEYWSGLPFPSPESFPNSGIEHRSHAAGRKKFCLHALVTMDSAEVNIEVHVIFSNYIFL